MDEWKGSLKGIAVGWKEDGINELIAGWFPSFTV
jgi:hypothetical protein